MAIVTKKLSNGLELILDENHDLPVVSLQILVRVGSADETDKEAGISHLIEHMLFKGTPRRPVGAIAMEIEAAGGEVNAYTSLDQTVYYLSMASKFWGQGLDILADAVNNSIFDPVELEREKEVVLEEISRGNDDPGHYVGEVLLKNVYGSHPYGRPIIGYSKTVKGFTRDDVIKFHKKWYVPSNISVIAVGDFSTKKIIELCKKMFPSKKKAAPKRSKFISPRTTKKISTGFRSLNSAHYTIGYAIPDITHPDIPAIDAAAYILGGGRASMLEQELKEKQSLVHRIYSYALTPRSNGIFMVYARLLDKDLKKTSQEIQKQIEKLAKNGPSEGELERAKQIICADEIYEKETVGGLAGKLAYFRATAGSCEFENEYYKRLRAVDVEDIKRVIKKYLNPSKSVTSLLLPKGSKHTKLYKPTKNNILIKVSNDKSNKEPTVIKLKSGSTLIVQEDKRLPLVGVCVAYKGGIRSETKSNNGISELMTRSLVKGTKRLSAKMLATEVDGMSSHLEAFSGKNSFGVKGQFLSQHSDRFWPLFMEVIAEPAFDPIEVKKEQLYLLRSIQDEEDSYASLAAQSTLKKMFPNHPYGMRMLGEKKTVSKLTPKDVVKQYNSLVTRKGAVISVVGDCNQEEVREYFENMMLTLSSKDPFNKKLKEGAMSSKKNEVIKKSGREQAHVIVGGRGTTIRSVDRYPLAVTEQILTGMGGRLFIELRDKQSLAYALGMRLQLGVEPGYYLLYIGTDPSKVEVAIKGMNFELEKLSSGKIPKEEMERAKRHIVGAYVLGKQRQLARASEYAVNGLYGISTYDVDHYPDYINKVKASDISRVIKKYLDPKKTITTVVTP